MLLASYSVWRLATRPREADVAAIFVQTDALDEIGDSLLAEAVVGACGAGLGALVARLDTAGEHFRVEIEVPWMGLEHRRCVGHVVLSRVLDAVYGRYRAWVPEPGRETQTLVTAATRVSAR